MAFAFELIAKDRGAKICLPDNKSRYYRFDGSMWVTFKTGDKERDCYDSELKEIAANHNWKLYEEPAAEVEVFEWMYCVDSETWWLSGHLFTEAEAAENFSEESKYRKTGRSWRVPVK